MVISVSGFSQKAKLLQQETIDSLRFVGENLHYEDDIVFTIKNNKDVKAWTKYYLIKAFRCLTERKNDSSVFYADKAIEAFQKTEHEYLPSAGIMHKAYYIKGLRAYFKRKYITAINNFNTGLDYIEKYPKCYDGKSWKPYIYGFLSSSHYDMGDLDLAIFYKKERLNDYRMKFKFFSTVTYLDLGNLYAVNGNLDSAKFYNRKALEIFKDSTIKHSGYARETSLHLNKICSYNNLGEYHYKESTIDSALFYFKKAHQEYLKKKLDYKEKDLSKIKFFTKANYSYLLFKEDSLAKAKRLLLSLVDSIHTFPKYSRENRRLYLRVQEYLKQVYEKEGNYQEIVAQDQKVIEYLKRYNEENISQHLQLLSVEFDTNSKRKTIQSLSEIKEEQGAKIEQYQITIVVLVLFVIVSVLFLAFYRKNKKKQYEYEKGLLKQRLMLMQMNPHFIFNAFSAINGKIASRAENTTQYVQKLSHLFRNVLKNSSQEFISLGEELELLQNYLEIQSDFLQKFQFEIHTDKELDPEIILIPPMLVQPLLENSIIHGIKGEKGFIQLEVVKERDTLLVKVSDNGVGFTEKQMDLQENKQSSFSTSLINKRLQLLSKKFSLEYKSLEKGTCACLYLPLIKDEDVF